MKLHMYMYFGGEEYKIMIIKKKMEKADFYSESKKSMWPNIF